MCHGVVRKAEIEERFGIRFDEEFASALERLEELRRDGLVELSPAEVRATPLGRLFLRNLAMPFDAYLDKGSAGREAGRRLAQRTVVRRDALTLLPLKRAILFLQLGGPETLDDVRGFLYRLFSDPDVITVRSNLLRKAIAASIAVGRQKASRALYASIGGGSPIRRLTEEQARGVEAVLRGAGRDAVVRAAMTCSAPLVEDVVAELAAAGVDRFLALPLYPQYSLTTTKGSLERSRAAVARSAPRAQLFETGSFPTHPLFVEAHAEGIREELARFPDPRPEAVHLLFSAHSIPKKLVDRKGDPYQREIEASVAAIRDRLGWTGSLHSRVPVEAGARRVARAGHDRRHRQAGRSRREAGPRRSDRVRHRPRGDALRGRPALRRRGAARGHLPLPAHAGTQRASDVPAGARRRRVVRRGLLGGVIHSNRA